MTSLYLAGIFFLVIGVVAIALRKPVGVLFCRFGKAIFRTTPFGDLLPVESVFDEETAPAKIAYMGVVLVVQSPFLILLGYLLRD